MCRYTPLYISMHVGITRLFSLSLSSFKSVNKTIKAHLQRQKKDATISFAAWHCASVSSCLTLYVLCTLCRCLKLFRDIIIQIIFQNIFYYTMYYDDMLLEGAIKRDYSLCLCNFLRLCINLRWQKGYMYLCRYVCM